MEHINFLTHMRSTAAEGVAPFIKMHGLGNNFVILDGRTRPDLLAQIDVRQICDTHTGVGAEQVVVIEPSSGRKDAAGTYARIRFFNVDGKEVGACGNATRCVASLLLAECRQKHIRLDTLGGVLDCFPAASGDVSVTLGPINDGWTKDSALAAVDKKHMTVESGPFKDGTVLYIGNPHIVYFVDKIDVEQLVKYGPCIQNNSSFRDGINVDIAQVIDHKSLRLVVWERPGLLTTACGTGACVAAYSALQRGLVTSTDIDVVFGAGALKIHLNSDKTAIMTGPVGFCCCGFVPSRGNDALGRRFARNV